MTDRVDALRDVIGEYEDERALTISRLDKHTQRRDQLELARELLVEHGELAEADQLKVQIQELERHIGASREMIARLDGLIAMYQTSLDRISRKQAP